MLYRILITLLVIDCFILVAAILMQAGKGGGLAASFGGASSTAEALIGSRQAGNLLTKASWWCGGIFLGLAFVLSMISVRPRTPGSVLDRMAQPPAPATTPATGGAAPAIPLEPAQPAPQGQGTPAPTTPSTPQR